MKRILWLALAAAAMGSGGASAAYLLPGIQVTASRVASPADLSTAAVEVVTKEDMDRLGAYDIPSALSLALSLDLSEAGRTEGMPVAGRAVMIRGMNTNHTLILVDGMRLADEDTSQTRNVYALSRIPLSRVTRIEIVRGAGSALYGSDAMGGVINIITKEPEQAAGSWTVSSGTRETASAFTAASGRMGRWSTAVTGAWTHMRPVRHPQDRWDILAADPEIALRTAGDDRPGYGYRRQLHIDSTYALDKDNQKEIRIGAGYFEEDSRTAYADSTAEAMGMNLPVSVGKEERIARTLWDGSLAYSGRTAAHEYTFRLYGSRLKKDFVSFNGRPDFGALESVLGGLYPRYESDWAVYTTAVLEGRDTLRRGSHTLTYGGEYGAYTYEGTRLAAAGEAASHRYETGAVYLSDLWQAAPDLYIAPSLRTERNSRSGSAVTPRLGLTWSLSPHTRLKADFGLGYRAPSISEMYLRMERATPIGIVEVTGNPSLSPEKSRNWSVAAEMERGETGVSISYFQNDLTDLIDTVRTGPGRQYRYDNIRRARIRGVETELRHPLTSHLTARLTGTLLQAEDRTGHTRLDGRARSRWQAALLYDSGSWDGALWMTFSGDYRFDGQDYTWHTLHLSAEKRWRSYALRFGVDNVLDKQIDTLYLTGRQWHLSVEKTW